MTFATPTTSPAVRGRPGVGPDGDRGLANDSRWSGATLPRLGRSVRSRQLEAVAGRPDLRRRVGVPGIRLRGQRIVAPCDRLALDPAVARRSARAQALCSASLRGAYVHGWRHPPARIAPRLQQALGVDLALLFLLFKPRAGLVICSPLNRARVIRPPIRPHAARWRRSSGPTSRRRVPGERRSGRSGDGAMAAKTADVLVISKAFYRFRVRGETRPTWPSSITPWPTPAAPAVCCTRRPALLADKRRRERYPVRNEVRC